MKVAPADRVPEAVLPVAGAAGVFIRVLIGPDDNATRFMTLGLRISPGGHTPLHSHPWEEQVLVVAGKGEVTAGEQGHALEPGHVVFAAPGEAHQFRNTGSSDLELICAIPVATNRDEVEEG